MTKYKLTDDTTEVCGVKLYRIQAVKDFGDVKAGDLGGYIQSEQNLSHDGDCWVYGDAQVYDQAKVIDQAQVGDQAKVYGDALVRNNYHIMWISNIESKSGTTTFFTSKDAEILVSCGCFSGTIEEFERKVKQTHGENVHAKAYDLAIQMAKIKLAKAVEEINRKDVQHNESNRS